MSEELMITKKDLVNWLNRPPSNDDLDLIGFITTRLENFYKLEQENKQLKEQLDIHKILLQTNAPSTCILTELEEWCDIGIKDEIYVFDYGTELIGEPIKIHITSYEFVLEEIKKLKEKYNYEYTNKI